MGDDEDAAVEAAQPRFQPFQHADVQVVGGFVEEEQLGFIQQDEDEGEARFLAAAEAAHQQIVV